MNKKETAPVAASAQENKADNGIVARSADQTATDQLEAVADLYMMFFSRQGSALITTDSDHAAAVLQRFGLLFDDMAENKPKDVTDLNRRWIPLFNAAHAVAVLMDQGQISVIRFGGHV